MSNLSIKQLSVFVEKRTGELMDVTKTLSNNDISIKSINLSEASDFGIVRLIVDKTDEATSCLKKEGFTVKESSVLCVEIDDYIGSFNRIVSALADKDIGIEYTYTLDSIKKGAFVFKIESNKLTEAQSILEKEGVTLLKEAP